MRGEPGELKHLSTPRKEINRESPSSGERTGSSPEPESVCVLVEASGKARDTGDSPVHKNAHAVSSMSRAGHVVSCLNMGGPSSKAKYS